MIDYNGQQIIATIEKAFECTGLCDYGNFYFALPITNGPPTKACLDSFKKLYNNVTLNIGIVLVFSFITTFITFLMQYWLCRKDAHKDYSKTTQVTTMSPNPKAAPAYANVNTSANNISSMQTPPY
jgi:hypothetical protein